MREAGATDAELQDVCSIAMAVGAFKTKLFFVKLSGISGAPAPQPQAESAAPPAPSGIA